MGELLPLRTIWDLTLMRVAILLIIELGAVAPSLATFELAIANSGRARAAPFKNLKIKKIFVII